MMNWTRSGIALAAATLLSVNAWAGEKPAKHGHSHSHSHGETFSAGEPGNPKKPSRTIQVTMRESDGKMLFVPARLEVRKGEQIKFVLRNIGELEHEFVLATTTENLKHAEDMKNNPNMAHEEPNGKEVDPKKTGEILWKFTKAGEFEYACLIPGHREAGMTGTIVVK
ncbi:cupredoxin family protein [Bradyrhizobium sp.]|uniref:cupredoxin domain-containing protein n=1 Tax=Bradyrhizobium sp. TaxID=376 RepID=UPI0027358DC5|nr:cupredoxin family protein [Bradyrhizobium sp.]MDP3074408.1 cupredoxin family protein [Bradyrhizobium sp.]